MINSCIENLYIWISCFESMCSTRNWHGTSQKVFLVPPKIQASRQSKSSGGEEIAVALLGLYIRPLENDWSVASGNSDMESGENISDDDAPVLDVGDARWISTPSGAPDLPCLFKMQETSWDKARCRKMRLMPHGWTINLWTTYLCNIDKSW